MDERGVEVEDAGDGLREFVNADEFTAREVVDAGFAEAHDLLDAGSEVGGVGGRAPLVRHDVDHLALREFIDDPEGDVGAAQRLTNAVDEDRAGDGPLVEPRLARGVFGSQLRLAVIIDRAGAVFFAVRAVFAVEDEIRRDLDEAGPDGVTLPGQVFDRLCVG